MIYSSLDSSRQDESNDSTIIPIGAIFAKITIFAKFQIGSGRVNCLTRPEFSGWVRSGTRISGQKCGALYRGNVINFLQDIREFTKRLPRTPSSIDILIVRRQSADDLTVFQNFI